MIISTKQLFTGLNVFRKDDIDANYLTMLILNNKLMYNVDICKSI